MADYSVSFVRSARKELESLPNPLLRRILIKIKRSRRTRDRGLQEAKRELEIFGEYG